MDDLKGHSRSEIYFMLEDKYYLLEAKSESETSGSRHPGWQGSFADLRRSIKTLNFDNRYSKWLLYLSQLFDYTSEEKRATKANSFQIQNRFAILGLPLTKLEDCKNAISKVKETISSSVLDYEVKSSAELNVAIIIFKEADLSSFMDRIVTTSR